MMILRSSPASPFVRKARIAADVVGLTGRIRLDFADTNDPNDSLRRQNPLGKIPVLITASGQAIFDSRVIVEYLDHLAGGGVLIPREADARFRVLTLQATADGLMDASILRVYEGRFREEAHRDAAWLKYQSDKTARALAALEASPPAVATDVGAIALACALGYLDLRFAGEWRAAHPALVAWLDAFATRVPAFAATRFEPV
jgi:glutathione S-transferase